MTLASFSVAQILRLQPALRTFFLLTSTAQKKQCTWRSLLHYKWHTVVAVFIFTVYNFAYQNQKCSLVMLNWSVTHWHVAALTVPSFAKFTGVLKKIISASEMSKISCCCCVPFAEGFKQRVPDRLESTGFYWWIIICRHFTGVQDEN